MKVANNKDFIDFANILRNYLGQENGRTLSQGKYVRKLFENICIADIDTCISSDDGTLGAYLSKRSIYPNSSRALLSSVDKKKFNQWIENGLPTSSARKALLKNLRSFISSRLRFRPREKELLALCKPESIGKFVSEIFVVVLERPDQQSYSTSDTEYITAHSKKAVQHFVGRATESNSIHKMLVADSAQPASIWIHGMGGLGKTQLCRKVLSGLDGEFPFLGWIAYDGNFKQSLVNQVHCETDSFDLEQAYQDALEFINNKGTSLVLFIDNVSRSAFVDEELAKLQCNVVITSRDASPDTFILHELGFLSLSDCKKIFYSYYKRTKEDCVKEVIHQAGYLTLAVELLAKTAHKRDISINDLLLELTKKSFDLRTVVSTNWDNDTKAQNEAVSKQFQIVFSLSGIMNDDEKIYILKNMALLPYLATDQALLCEWLGLDEEKNAIYDLHEFGWVQYFDDYHGYLLHPIIKYTVRTNLKPTFSDCEHLVSSINENIVFSEVKTVFEVLTFVPYAQEIAEYFRNEASNPVGVALLYIHLANVFRANGEYTSAWEYGQVAEVFIESDQSADKNTLCLVYNILNEICTDMRDKDVEGIRYAELAIKAVESSNAPDQVLRSSAYHNLAGLLAQQGEDFDRAKKIALKAIEIRKDLGSEHCIYLANTYRSMAFILRNSGDTNGACEYMELAIPIMKKVYANNPDHPNLAITYNNYARILRDIEGRLDEAIGYCQESIGMRERNNPDDPRLSRNHHNLAMAYSKNGDYARAIDHFKTSIMIDIKNKGLEHPDLAKTYYNLAKVYFDTGDPRQALTNIDNSMKIKMSSYNELECLCLKARCYNALKQPQHAKQVIAYMMKFRDTNAIDPSHLENYNECVEINRS